MLATKFVFDDGGRGAAGYKGYARDCACRSIAIVTNIPYQEVYDSLNAFSSTERCRKRSRSSARNGVYKATLRRYLERLGFVWIPTMHVGSGCTVHLRAQELPEGRLVVCVSRHITAMIDGVIHDSHDCSRNGTRCVYGYFYHPLLRGSASSKSDAAIRPTQGS